MSFFLDTKSNSQRAILFTLTAVTLTIGWGIIGRYIFFAYYVFSTLFYLGIFLLGILFRMNNSLFIPFTYLLIYCSDLVCRMVAIENSNSLIYNFLIFYHIELILLTIMKICFDAKEYSMNVKQKWQNVGIAIFLPIVVLFIYNFIVRQLFVFE
jgi:hypothetical protein